VVNLSTGNQRAPVTVSVWVPPDVDLEKAHAALEGEEVTSARIVEITHEGARLELKAAMEPDWDRQKRESELRERAQSALRSAGLLNPG